MLSSAASGHATEAATFSSRPSCRSATRPLAACRTASLLGKLGAALAASPACACKRTYGRPIIRRCPRALPSTCAPACPGRYGAFSSLISKYSSCWRSRTTDPEHLAKAKLLLPSQLRRRGSRVPGSRQWPVGMLIIGGCRGPLCDAYAGREALPERSGRKFRPGELNRGWASG
jgi:hypothetical protein